MDGSLPSGILASSCITARLPACLSVCHRAMRYTNNVGVRSTSRTAMRPFYSTADVPRIRSSGPVGVGVGRSLRERHRLS
ncbi:hypothetical protein BO71DRAFT_395055, partial [Aspergillus ellipticus CBS 707.79]